MEPDFPDNASSAHQKDTGKSELINRIGQPTFSTHAHLFNSVNELTPGITKSEYKSRRTRLGELLPENSVAILISGDVSHYPNTVIPHANYRQDSDFMYFSGMMQPHSAMMLIKDGEDKPLKYVLFSRRYEKRDETWNGWRAHPEMAKAFFECDESVAIETMEEYLRNFLKTPISRRQIFMDRERFTTTTYGNQVLKVVTDGAFLRKR